MSKIPRSLEYSYSQLKVGFCIASEIAKYHKDRYIGSGKFAQASILNNSQNYIEMVSDLRWFD